ncbi:hypothetical protein AB1I68_03655 [Paenibacillus pabuli]
MADEWIASKVVIPKVNHGTSRDVPFVVENNESTSTSIRAEKPV